VLVVADRPDRSTHRAQATVQGLKSLAVAADEGSVKQRRSHASGEADLALPGPLGVEVKPDDQGGEPTGDPDLSLCGGCGSSLVQPIDWSLVGRSHWRVTLCCPNCEWSGTGVFTQEAVDRFDHELDRGMRELQSTLTRVTRACMEAEIATFAKALEDELIVPFDFTHRT
jgi:hypothetical protein